MFAADRGNARVASRFDPISAPVLRALKQIVDAGKAHNKPVALCGELASKPLEALALIAIGFRRLSLSPSAMGPVKAMILSTDARAAAKFIEPLLADTRGKLQIREKLTDFAEKSGISLSL
jgi:phosphotransferase system enzyme I (PtsP)